MPPFTWGRRRSHALGQLLGAGAVGVKGDDHEFLAAQAADQVALACRGLEYSGDVAQDMFTGLVTMDSRKLRGGNRSLALDGAQRRPRLSLHSRGIRHGISNQRIVGT